jgi:protocatechuate 3,4-dioxygenase beta subunit
MKISFEVITLPAVLTLLSITACSGQRANAGNSVGTNTRPTEQASPTQKAAEDSASAIERYTKLLEKDPADANAREALKRLIDSPNPVSNEHSQRIREILRQYARAETISLISKDEPGDRLNVSGTVRDSAGKPVAGAVLSAFQTDANGHYTRVRVMNEPNARLFGFLKTDSAGHFEFNTIRPGGYPGAPGREGEEWRIPQHIHIQVTAAGYQFRNFQMVFEDDPRMTPYWHEWARKGNNPVMKVNRDKDGVQHVVCDITLQSSGQ